jgi:hypothetical protein
MVITSRLFAPEILLSALSGGAVLKASGDNVSDVLPVIYATKR